MAADVGAHYRYEYRGIKLDPYRICAIYGITGGPREHMIKKLLRGDNKGHEEMFLIDELENILQRWKGMIIEDRYLADVSV